MKKVRVTYKHFINKKTGTMYMSEEAIKWYRNNKGFSPYKAIRKIK